MAKLTLKDGSIVEGTQEEIAFLLKPNHVAKKAEVKVVRRFRKKYSRIPWSTKDDATLTEMWIAGAPARSIGRRLNPSRHGYSVHNRVAKLRLEGAHLPRRNPELTKKVSVEKKGVTA